jgi:hypothetical protein
MDYDEPLLVNSQQVEQLENDYDLYCMFLSKIELQLQEIERIQDNRERSYAVKEIIPKIEKLGDYLNSLNHRIKGIEASGLEKKFNNKTVKDIKQQAASKYEIFNKRFLELVNVKKTKSNEVNTNSNTNNYQENTQESSIRSNAKVDQVVINVRKQTSSSLDSLKQELKHLRQEDLEMILKISNQTMQISQEMKKSLSRAEGSINTLEANVIDIKENLKNANKETTKLHGNNNSSICNYIWLLITITILVVALIFFVYYLWK